MNRYDPRTPRTFAGFAAAAITVAMLALTVVLPAASRPATADDIATRVTSEQCVVAGDNAITAMNVVAERRARATPLAQSRGTPRDAQG